MTFAAAGTLGVLPGKRDALVALLTRRNDRLRALGRIAHEVGTNEEEPDTVFVVELWESAAAHRASLQETDVLDAIAEARVLLDGRFGGFRFDVAGLPLRD